MMFFDILTLFPDMFEGAFSDSIIKRAIQKELISIDIRNIRDYSPDEKHRSVDDYPYGGDAGMLLRPEPVVNALNDSRKRLQSLKPTVVYLTPCGEKLNQEIVKSFLSQKALILLCGRYKGVDQRVVDRYVDREISVGDYVLSGGEVPAMVLVDAITRLVPGVLGNIDSAEADSFYSGILSHPQYTRPEYFEGMRVPEVLLSGNHANIKKWQHQKALEITQKRRPDLLNGDN
ncbi:tRNA (Guanine37-N1) -methyltransferase [Chitinispirillum alkaliphilum]|nr:tRNA (Guanine37-N1) -methyltransferase [Chitinispirillum alkaliphilum]